MFRVGIYGMENQVLMSEIVKNRKKRNKKEKIKDQSRIFWQISVRKRCTRHFSCKWEIITGILGNVEYSFMKHVSGKIKEFFQHMYSYET